MNKAFVFVVCGGKEHIDTLHFSLKTFRQKTEYPSIVITDSKRNEIPVIHENVIDVSTPEHLDHHQASIYLKTSLHRYLPEDGKYVYMDTDILAVGKNVNDIFEQYIPPIRFALDHCDMPFFSPTAMACGCKAEYDALIQKINQYVESVDPLMNSQDEKVIHQRMLLKRQLVQAFKNKPALILKGLKFLTSWPVYKFSPQFRFNRKTNIWQDADGNPVMTNVKWAKVAKKFGLRFNYLTFDIKFPNGESIWINQCNHLKEGIRKKFNVDVQDEKFHHWNGGVFLFDKQSHDFLEFWHTSTMEIFKDPEWKTRDQGTLIATVWKFQLQQHPPLDEKWNYICDFNNSLFGYRAEDGTLTKNQKKYIQPEFVHVYHHFGDTSWDFWNWITGKAKVE